MKLNELKPPSGAKHRRKRVGRGDGSGHGNYSTRGLKGQKARSGGAMPPWFEGGQLPLIRRLPRKPGFHNPFRREYSEVNLKALERLPGEETEITPQRMVELGLVKSLKYPVKVLGDGELHRPLVVRAHRFSASAKGKIEAAGGKAEAIEGGGEDGGERKA